MLEEKYQKVRALLLKVLTSKYREETELAITIKAPPHYVRNTLLRLKKEGIVSDRYQHKKTILWRYWKIVD